MCVSIICIMLWVGGYNIVLKMDVLPLLSFSPEYTPLHCPEKNTHAPLSLCLSRVSGLSLCHQVSVCLSLSQSVYLPLKHRE